MKKAKYLLMGILFLFWESQALSQSTLYLSEDEGLQAKEAMMNIRVISRALQWWLQAELQIPESYNSLCSTPYIPVRCEDLLNPYTHQPIMDEKDSAGNLHLEPHPEGVLISYYWLRGGELITWSAELNPEIKGRGATRPSLNPPKITWLDVYQERAKQLKESSIPEKLKPLSFEEKTALTVGFYLYTVLLSYRGEYRKFPRSIKEVYQKVQQANPYKDWRDINRVWKVYQLRNEFTQGYAYELSKPSPGNYHYYRNELFGHILIVYGKNRKPIFKAYLDKGIVQYGYGGRSIEEGFP